MRDADQPRPATEVTITELDRSASRVIARVVGGELVVVSKHGAPVAFVLPIEAAVALLPAEVTMSGAMRRLAEEFERRDLRRTLSRYAHGRWRDRLRREAR